MKSLILLTTSITGALASAIQFPNLMDRDIDPATMNPTLFSVLSVLKTGMPTGPNVPTPTGNSEPEWYQELPADVKSLLPELYPAAAVATSEAQSSRSQAAQSEGVKSTDAVVAVVVSASSSLLSTSPSVSAFSTSIATLSPSPSPSPSTPQTKLTKSPQSASTITDTISPSSSTLSSDSTSPITPSSTLATASATPSNSLSLGTRFVVKTEALAAIAMFSVGAGFCIFA